MCTDNDQNLKRIATILGKIRMGGWYHNVGDIARDIAQVIPNVEDTPVWIPPSPASFWRGIEGVAKNRMRSDLWVGRKGAAADKAHQIQNRLRNVQDTRVGEAYSRWVSLATEEFESTGLRHPIAPREIIDSKLWHRILDEMEREYALNLTWLRLPKDYYAQLAKLDDEANPGGKAKLPTGDEILALWLTSTTCGRRKREILFENDTHVVLRHSGHSEYIGGFTGTSYCPTYAELYEKRHLLLENGALDLGAIKYGNKEIRKWTGRLSKKQIIEDCAQMNVHFKEKG